MTPHGDAGVQVLDGIYTKLMIDEAWTLRRPRGFTWIGWRLAQHMDASALFEDLDMQVSRVRVVTEVLRNVTASDGDVSLCLMVLNRTATGSAWLFDPASRSVSAALGNIVDDETIQFRIGQLATYAILQLEEAERLAPSLAEFLGGEVATVRHPSNGHREQPDGMFEIMSMVHEHSGDSSRFADDAEMRSVYENVRATGGWAFSAGGGPDGITIETPFGPTDTALIELLPRVAHPTLGNGLLVLSRLRPFGDTSSRAARQLSENLNRTSLEEFSVVPMLGAWSVWELNDHWSVAFSSFVPNLVAFPGVALNWAGSAMVRMQILDRMIYPSLGERRALDVCAQRLGLDLKANDTAGRSRSRTS